MVSADRCRMLPGEPLFLENFIERLGQETPCVIYFLIAKSGIAARLHIPRRG